MRKICCFTRYGREYIGPFFFIQESEKNTLKMGVKFAASLDMGETRVEPVGVNPLSNVFPNPQVIPISDFRLLSLLVFVVWPFEMFSLFGSD